MCREAFEVSDGPAKGIRPKTEKFNILTENLDYLEFGDQETTADSEQTLVNIAGFLTGGRRRAMARTLGASTSDNLRCPPASW